MRTDKLHERDSDKKGPKSENFEDVICEWSLIRLSEYQFITFMMTKAENFK